jgi:hypothetical protein
MIVTGSKCGHAHTPNRTDNRTDNRTHIRHPREGGDPGLRSHSGYDWIPAFAGMTVGAGATIAAGVAIAAGMTVGAGVTVRVRLAGAAML